MALYERERWRWVLLWMVLASLSSATTVVRGQSGFLKIDCGKEEGYSSTDSTLGLVYTSDHEFVSTGETHKVAATYLRGNDFRDGFDLRSFPDGKRNCYRLPLKPDYKYLLRTSYLYGNYDEKEELPQFAVYLDVNYMDFVNYIDNASIYYYRDMVFMAGSRSSVNLCFVNTEGGTPFISAIELRPLPVEMYPHADASQALLNLIRKNIGASDPTLRYPDDPYDRMWISEGASYLSTLTTTFNIESLSPGYEPPPGVLKTAVYPTQGSSLNFSLSRTIDATIVNPRVRVYLYIAELQQPVANKSRLFNIYVNDELRTTEPLKPVYLKGLTYGTVYPDKPSPLKFAFVSTRESTLPPILNGVEVYLLKDMTGDVTVPEDVVAIASIKEFYKVQKNWQGDPCCPSEYIWEGLTCSSRGYNTTGIISLNLSSSGLTGEISPAIVNLMDLKILDLSRNSLTGGIPAFLATLAKLEYLDLTGNQLVGPVPNSLRDRSTSGTLILKVQFDSSNGSTSSNKKKSKTKMIVVVAAIVGILLLGGVLIVALILYRKKMNQRGGTKEPQHGNYPVSPKNDINISVGLPPLPTENRQFTYSDLTRITKNFTKEIGRGGFGHVYYGVQDNNVEVAVKLLSNSSSQGPKEFQNEAIVLTRVYHRRLVSLIGYCNDSIKNLALVYEYMANGSLEDHLQGRVSRSNNPLSWMSRLRIAREAAEGLEYLHYGCKPGMVHRDVKTSNILLSENFESKLADFGLCKIFENEFTTHITTKIMGTFGYIDPEYSITNRLTTRSDVYAFGVVLFELTTGLPPIIRSNNNKVALVQWVHEKLKVGNIEEIADEKLQGGYNSNSIWKVLEIAVACTEIESIKRPNIRVVLGQLTDCLELETSTTEGHSMSQNTFTTTSNMPTEIMTSNVSIFTQPSVR